MIPGRGIAVGLCAAAIGLLSAAARAQKRPTAPALDLDAMVEFEAGVFRMGHPGGTPGPYGDEWFIDQTPEHEVRLGRFYLDRDEVSVSDFALFLTWAGGETHFDPDQPIDRVAGGYLARPGAEREPIRQLTWQAAAHFCAWAGKRLPTEAEWERAAAGQDDRPFPWGDASPSCRLAAFFTGSVPCSAGPVTIDALPDGRSPEGASHLAGNVAEWVADWYAPYPDEAQVDPTGPSSGAFKVVRGGGFVDSALQLRTHARRAVPPASRAEDIGFRCAWSAEEAEPALRGTLDPAADIGRRAPEMAYGPPTPGPDRLADGLDRPMGIVELDGSLFVAERGAGRLLRLHADGAVEIVALGLDEPGAIAACQGHLLVCETGAGRLSRIRAADGRVEVWIAGLADGPNDVLCEGGFVTLATQGEIWRGSLEGGGALLAEGFDGLGGIAEIEGFIYFTERGDAQLGQRRIGRIDPGSGEVETIVPASDFGMSVVPRDVAGYPVSNPPQVLFSAYYEGWPYSGGVCLLNPLTGRYDFLDHSPPQPDRIAVDGRTVYWTCRYALARLLPDAPGFDLPGVWSLPGGLSAGPAGLVWTGRQSGQVLRIP
ncbi:MAG: SUMF1/EgtB/PvdO family nonheme iron enzyme [Deltaproteobacteria bacterium]|nr:SUMF1/EgtB/PvdO family nonheme iron enzyme [Deltaproteobacteria bacterium]